MLNKILSKKIKSPLSLRGAKRRSNLSGFSLIELMVAVAILAMAIFGIFNAYSVGFMGMVDARDRTVATNYAREAMEDIKNMDFVSIITQPRTFINGTKFEREVIVPPQENPNLKKIITKVYWKDRKDNTKTVETDMLVHFIETTAGAATRIILVADPYNVLTGGTSTIIAVVKDAKGNTVTTYSDNISFSITSGSGNLSSSPVSPNRGIANTTFTAFGTEGDVIIEASSGDLTSDTVTIKVTNPDKPIKIELTATPKFMIASTSSESTIKAEIKDAGGDTVAISKEITFSRSGPGSLSTPTTLSTVDENGNPTGVATIILTSNNPPGGTITVTASSTDLEPGVIDVITGGQITLSASPINVPEGEQSVITITTKDVNGVPINYEGTINLSVESLGGSGTLPSGSVTFYGTASSETVTFTASLEGDVNIKANDSASILEDGTLPLTITSALIPYRIEVYAYPSSIPAAGTETSTITARIKTDDNITITSYTDLITFTTTEGTFNYDGGPSIVGLYVDENGVATVELFPPTNSGIATINVSSGDLDDVTVEVGFYIDANHIQLVANPQHIKVLGGNPDSCWITATIKDAEGHTVSGYDGKVKFSIISGDGKFPLTGSTMVIVVNGEAQILLQAGNSPGTITVKATSKGVDFEGYLNVPVGISLTLEGTPTYDSTYKSFTFNISIQGADLSLEEMQISWDSSDGETLDKIEIKSPDAPNHMVVFESTALSGELIDITDINLSTGISNIKLYFNCDMSGKTTLDVTFNPYSGSYIVNLK